MKRLIVHLTIAILMFLIGITLTKFSSIELLPSGIHHPNNFTFHEQGVSIPEPKQTPVQNHQSKNLIKIADIPSDAEHYSFSMQALNEKEIWISSKEKMWRTRDGGKTWKLVYNGGKSKYDITYDIVHYQFINSEVGWMLLIKGVNSDFSMQLYKTEDGGDTWQRMAQPIDENFVSFQFLDELHGWSAGTVLRRIPKNEARFIRPRNIFLGKDALYAAIYYTEDGGKSWRQQLIPSRPNSITDLSMLDAEHGWAWGDAGNFYLDNGRWKEINYNETKCNDKRVKVRHLEIDAGNPYIGAVGVSFINSKVGWMSHSEGYLAKTTDGGRTWCDLINPEDIWGKQEFPMYYFYGIKFFDSEHGYGFDEESLYETMDGGVTWTKLDFGMDSLSFTLTDSHHAWAVSKEGLFQINLPRLLRQ
jgi:photosystem II stability/assembly factor-like uncharacterized protein